MPTEYVFSISKKSFTEYYKGILDGFMYFCDGKYCIDSKRNKIYITVYASASEMDAIIDIFSKLIPTEELYKLREEILFNKMFNSCI